MEKRNKKFEGIFCQHTLKSSFVGICDAFHPQYMSCRFRNTYYVREGCHWAGDARGGCGQRYKMGDEWKRGIAKERGELRE